MNVRFQRGSSTTPTRKPSKARQASMSFIRDCFEPIKVRYPSSTDSRQLNSRCLGCNAFEALHTKGIEFGVTVCIGNIAYPSSLFQSLLKNRISLLRFPSLLAMPCSMASTPPYVQELKFVPFNSIRAYLPYHFPLLYRYALPP